MKKNILVIGYGDIANRLNLILDKDKYDLYGISRTNKEANIKNHIKWNWLSTNSPELEEKNFETIIFLPKPSSIDEDGYNKGFIQSTENIFSFTKDIIFNKFITISSTRVYGKNKKDLCFESDDIEPKEFRAKIINQYESNQIERYANKLFILRFSGLTAQSLRKNLQTLYIEIMQPKLFISLYKIVQITMVIRSLIAQRIQSIIFPIIN